MVVYIFAALEPDFSLHNVSFVMLETANEILSLDALLHKRE